jgi:class 3 adenylate cyclase
MPRPRSKSLRNPDQVRRFPNGQIETVAHSEATIGRFRLQPGWRWSNDVRPIAHTHTCQLHHLGLVLKGRLRVETDDGEVCEFGVDEVYDIPPGHDAAVVGDEPFEAIEFASARVFAAPTDGDRVLAAILCTDIVDSTVHLSRVGDAAWKELLLKHNQKARFEFNRFRGREIQTTGDGFLAIFDGPARAVRCAQEIGGAIAPLGIAIRAGVHTGEVELIGDNVRGLAVHEAARIAGVAGAHEIMVSATTMSLLEGSGLALEPRGRHELKGLTGARELFRVAPSA